MTPIAGVRPSQPPSLEASPIPDLSESSSEGSITGRLYGCLEGASTGVELEGLQREPLELGDGAVETGTSLTDTLCTERDGNQPNETPLAISELGTSHSDAQSEWAAFIPAADGHAVRSPAVSPILVEKPSPEVAFHQLMEAGGSLPHSPGSATDSYSADVSEHADPHLPLR